MAYAQTYVKRGCLQHAGTYATLSGVNRLIGITELRNSAKELIDSLDDGPVVVLRHNQPVALLIRPAEVDALRARIAELEARPRGRGRRA